MKQIASLTMKNIYSFSGFSGPYNPYKYKDYVVPRNVPSNKEVYETVRHLDKQIVPPVRNMRHINPVRQSGPLPPYSGTYTMEDIKKVFETTAFSNDFHYCQMDVDEVMRRVPGVTLLLNRYRENKFNIL